MEDYPRTLAELEARFGDEAACRDYLIALRWPNGFICPDCGHTVGWRVTPLRHECANCHRQVSATSGTIFHATRTPLTLWFRAIWWMVSQKNGASALGLQRVLGLGSYETAWTWLHKLRRAMIRPGRDRLAGLVEVDVVPVGGAQEGSPGARTLIVIAAQVNGTGIGRIRMRRLPSLSADAIADFVREAIAPGGTVLTSRKECADLSVPGYRMDRPPSSRGRKTVPMRLARVLRVESLFKRWILGTHQGAVSPAHLDHYLDEYVFRFNRRTSRHRGKLFYRCIEQAMQVEPAPYKALVKHVRGPQPKKRART